MTLESFRKKVAVSMEDICRDIYRQNRGTIHVKKEEVAVKNLVAIFESTLRLANVMGFQAMSLRDLSRESGLSMGALYAYFNSKEELLDIIQNQARREVALVLEENLEGLTDPRERLTAAIRTHLYLSEVMQGWFYFSYMEAKNLSHENQRKAIEGELFTEKIFSDILDQGMRSGIFSGNNPQMIASLIKAMLQDWYLKRWKYTRRKVSVDEYGDFLIAFTSSYLSPQTKKGGSST